MMNKRITLALGIGLTILLLSAVFATAAFAQRPGGAFGGMMNGWNRQGYGPGMMGGQAFGGMMGWRPQGSDGGSDVLANCPMFGAAANPANAQPITFDKAVVAAQQYLTRYNNADLKLAEVMEFENNFYALVTEKGDGAFELLVNRYTGVVTPEPGPNMMWNTKYGHMGNAGGIMGGMMGGFGGRQTGTMTVTVAQARTAAQQWLDANRAGATLADDEFQFSGYYIMDFLEDGNVAGMLSVNGYSGQVWYHTWHGAFISEDAF